MGRIFPKSRAAGRTRRQAIAVCLVAVLAMVACGEPEPTQPTADPNFPGQDPIRIALVTVSAPNDLAFAQSMVDSLARVGETRPVDVDITGGMFVVADAATVIRGYAKDGYDLVIAHGSQYGGPLAEIAADFPEVSFAWGTAVSTFGLPNVYSYTPRSDQGAFVLGAMAGEMTQSGVIGVVGPVAVGDAKRYIDGFAAGAVAHNPQADVNVIYIESFSDVALASEAANTHVSNGADILTGTAQMVVGAAAIAEDFGIPWFGTQSNQVPLGADIVVASQVYHWEVILEKILDDIAAGIRGGEEFVLTLENGGLIIAFNDQFPLAPAVRSLADETIAGIVNGTINTGIG